MVMSPTAGPEAQSLWKQSERIGALEWGLETGTGWKRGRSSFLILAASPFPLPRPQAAPAPVLRPRDQPGPRSIPLDVPQDGQQMFVALHREALEPSLIQMTVPDGRRSGARPSNASHACVPANGRRPSPGRLRPARRRSASLCLGWPDRSRDVSPYFLGHPDRIGPKGVVTILVEIA